MAKNENGHKKEKGIKLALRHLAAQSYCKDVENWEPISNWLGLIL